MTQKERMEKGLVYYCNDESILSDQALCLEKQYDYNATRPLESKKREALLKEMFAEIGEGTYIEPPLHSNWGGKNTHLGKWVYANFNLTLVDDTDIYIGDYTMIDTNIENATRNFFYGGDWGKDAAAGPFYQHTANGVTGKYTFVGARLMYVKGV